MALTLDEVYDALKAEWESTGRIAKRLRQTWSITYGQLSRLVAEGRAENVEVKCGTKNTNGWRRNEKFK